MWSGWLCKSGCGGLLFIWCTQKAKHPQPPRASSQHLICITGQSKRIVGFVFLFRLQWCVGCKGYFIPTDVCCFLHFRGLWAQRQTVDLGALTWINQLLDFFSQIFSQKGTNLHYQQRWNIFSGQVLIYIWHGSNLRINPVSSFHLQCSVPEWCFK